MGANRGWLLVSLVILAIAAGGAVALAAVSRMDEPGEMTGTGGSAVLPPATSTRLLADVGREAGPSYASHAVKLATAYIRDEASRNGGSFKLQDLNSDQWEQLTLLRFDRDSVRYIGSRRYLLQGEFRAADGRLCAVDFVLTGNRPAELRIERSFIQAIGGQPRYAWKREGKQWMAEPVAASGLGEREAANKMTAKAMTPAGSDDPPAVKSELSGESPARPALAGVISRYVEKRAATKGYFAIRDTSAHQMVRLTFDQVQPASLRQIGRDRWVARADFHSADNNHYALDFILIGKSPDNLKVKDALIQQVGNQDRYCWTLEGKEWLRLPLRPGDHCTV